MFELHTKLQMRSHPINHKCQDARKHPVQTIWLKQESNEQLKEDQILQSTIRRQYGTNQNLIGRPSNSYIDSAGCQYESLPKFLDEFVAPTQLKSIF